MIKIMTFATLIWNRVEAHTNKPISEFTTSNDLGETFINGVLHDLAMLHTIKVGGNSFAVLPINLPEYLSGLVVLRKNIKTILKLSTGLNGVNSRMLYGQQLALKLFINMVYGQIK